jgi:hypothetical protein
MNILQTVLSIFYMDVPGLFYLWVCSSVVKNII